MNLRSRIQRAAARAFVRLPPRVLRPLVGPRRRSPEGYELDLEVQALVWLTQLRNGPELYTGGLARARRVLDRSGSIAGCRRGGRLGRRTASSPGRRASAGRASTRPRLHEAGRRRASSGSTAAGGRSGRSSRTTERAARSRAGRASSSSRSTTVSPPSTRSRRPSRTRSPRRAGSSPTPRRSGIDPGAVARGGRQRRAATWRPRPRWP